MQNSGLGKIVLKEVFYAHQGCNTIQYNTIQYNTIQYNTIQYNTIQYNVYLYSTFKTTEVDHSAAHSMQNKNKSKSL